MPINAIVFDLDGTLVDTVPDVRLALNAMLADYGLNGIAKEKIHELIGHGARIMIQKAFAENNAQLPLNETESALEIYLRHYRANPVVETKIYPGVLNTLEVLRAAQFKLAVCTNKPSTMTQLVLNKLAMRDFFQIILSGDEVNYPKPHAEHLQIVLSHLQEPAEQAVMVGDSEVDMQCAANANVPFVGVSYGYHCGRLSAPTLIDQFADLPRALGVTL